jgi:glutamate carboxypeptidase
MSSNDRWWGTGDDAVGRSVAPEVRARLEPRIGEMTEVLGELVRIESPSGDPAGLAAMADRLEVLFGDLGSVVRHDIGPSGSCHLVVTVDGSQPYLEPTLVLCHHDTVWERGTLARLPFTVDSDGVATGPGCLDMKGGIVLLLFALRELRALGCVPRRSVRILSSCDEEVGSPTARPLIDELASGGVAAALVLEAPLPGGVLKTARKGIANYRLVVEGRAAHAGIEPHKGASAIVELAHQIHALAALADLDAGTSVNVGVIHGGTRPNVVAADASAEIDVRSATVAEARRVAAGVHGLEPVLTGARLTVADGLSRPPMERTGATAALFARAQAIAAAMGVTDLGEGSTGGASDGNLVAAKGIPTLDGLGPDGAGAHADDEHVIVSSMPARAALLAGLLAEV